MLEQSWFRRIFLLFSQNMLCRLKHDACCYDFLVYYDFLLLYMIYYYAKLCFMIYFIMIYYITIVIMIVKILKNIDYYYDTSSDFF